MNFIAPYKLYIYFIVVIEMSEFIIHNMKNGVEFYDDLIT